MENNSQAIEIKGIVRNQTKIGVQDGQCDDLINLRFKDGSWRVADDGKVMLDADTGAPFNANNYSQLYVHTNVYHHLLGVSNDKLYWFANIEADGESFTYIKDSNGVLSPVEICDVQGDVTIVQNGHLITIISGVSNDNSINYAIFKIGANEYKVLEVNTNGEQTDRMLFPFGKLHLNLDCSLDNERIFRDVNPDAGRLNLSSNYNSSLCSISKESSGELYPKDDEDKTYSAAKLWHASMLKVHNQAKENNYFTSPFIAVVAFRIYDGSFMIASNPILLSPRERYSDFNEAYDMDEKKHIHSDDGDFHFQRTGIKINHNKTEIIEDRTYVGVDEIGLAHYGLQGTGNYYGDSYILPTDRVPVYTGGANAKNYDHEGGASGIIKDYTSYQYLTSTICASSIIMTLGDIRHLDDTIFKSLCVFVTPEAYIYDMSYEGYKKGSFKQYSEAAENGTNWTLIGNLSYRPGVRTKKEIIHDLINSNFYLLREYPLNQLSGMINSSIKIDLSEPKYKGLLSNILQQEILPPESFGRSEYMPKVAYSYNQKLHIANYKSKLFHGYPIDSFQCNNHNIKISEGDFALVGVIPNAKDDVDFQYPKERTYFANSVRGNSVHTENEATQYIENADKYGIFFAEIVVELETSNGTSRVVRYIKPYNSNEVGTALSQPPFQNGDFAHFIEPLSPLLSYPDRRATSMGIYATFLKEDKVQMFTRSVTLTPHSYLNIAYYLDAELKPVELEKGFEMSLTAFNDNFYSHPLAEFLLTPAIELNVKDSFPNGLKVSATNNPLYFLYETTYQVGSSEIVALMSNAVAIGTGQTGAAPLYVFCKDGIYALMVDGSGGLTYTNARIIARDVCNNAKSVTPIDSGVVFTTDRGLMSIAGSEVVEIGSAVEGDVFDITDNGNLPTNPAMADKAKKIMFNAFTMQQLAEFPQSLIDNTDFLTYLKGAIVNYNHNERELMVSNPSKDYTYVMDRNGNWSKRAFTAQEYVNNYPTSYRIDKAGNFYKVDADDDDTNQVYLLSNVIKLGTIAFKQAYRLVVRGYFETVAAKLGLYVFGSYDGRQWALLGANERDDTYQSGKFTDIGCKISHTDIRFLRVCLAGKLSKNSRIDYIEVSLDGSMLNGKLR